MPVTTNQIYLSLTQTLPTVIEKVYRNLPFATGAIVPVQADLAAGAEFVLQDYYQEMGEADLLAGDAMDIPLVSVGMTQERKPVFMIAAGYDITFQSARGLSFAGRLATVTQKKQSVAARAIAERVHKFIAAGDARVNQTGFLNDPNVTTRTTTFDPTDPAITAVTFRSFLLDAIWHSYTARTGHTRFPASILLPPNMFRLGTDLLMPDSGLSVIDSVRQSIVSGDLGGVAPAALSIGQVPEAAADWLEDYGVKAAGTNEDRIVVYTAETEIMSAHMESLQLVPREWMGAEAGRQTFGNYECWTPTLIEQPYFMEYYDVPKSA